MGPKPASDNLKMELRDIVKKINKLWVSGNADKLGKFFHRDMIIVDSELRIMGEGREDCVRGYIEFYNQARIMKYAESDFIINVWGNAAQVGYAFDIRYEMDGQQYHDTGRDLFRFSRDDESGDWFVVWRMLIPAGNA